mmetsp:Transcript_23313/g.51497  ORF Transcript_23313/g.51497 Transcript_23313/m.51497 type:complete len:308 (+) Transcript_23313:2263-3186(+)
MAQSSIHEDAVLVPDPALHANVLMEGMEVLEVLTSQEDVVLGHQGHILHILRPNHIPNSAWHGDFVDHLTRRQVVHHYLLLALQQKSVVAAKIDVVRGDGRIKLLGQLVLEVINAYLPAVLQNGEAISCSEGHGLSSPLLCRHARVRGHLSGPHEEIIAAILRGVKDEDVNFCSVVHIVLQRLHPRGHGIWWSSARCHLVPLQPLFQVDDLNLLILNNIEVRAVAHRQRTLTVELEHYHASIVADCDEVRCAVRRDDPKSVVLPAEGVNPSSLGDIPDPNRPVFRVRKDQLLPRMEQHARDVVEVPA